MKQRTILFLQYSIKMHVTVLYEHSQKIRYVLKISRHPLIPKVRCYASHNFILNIHVVAHKRLSYVNFTIILPCLKMKQVTPLLCLMQRANC